MSDNISVYYQELLRQWSNSKEGKYRLKKCGESGDWALLSFAGWLDENATSVLRADLADAKARAKTAEENWHKNEARLGKLQAALYDLFQSCSDLPFTEMDRMEKEINAASFALRDTK